ncbi:MAG TPA: hypothetical protein VGR45_03000 [Stellaceae bacterium]|nr:hypothetical protein [Stellaceae bacterium]
MLRAIAISLAVLVAAAAPVRAQPAPAHAAATAQTTAKSSKPSRAANPSADEFSSEQAAKGHCPGDTVVWVNLGGSKAYHMSDDKYYGKTKHGAYMCQKEADQSGFHAGGRRNGSKVAKRTGSQTTK